MAAVVLLSASARSQDESPVDRGPVDRGKSLYARDCQSCHGIDGTGVSGTGPPIGGERVRGAGPSLVGVGARSVDFYLRTGYMPLDDPHDAPVRNDPSYNEEEIRAIVAYTDMAFGGPAIPEVRPERGSLQEGLRLFTDSCAGCHQMVAEGGEVRGGVAPELEEATPTQVAQAVRIGPYLMPKFGERALDQHAIDSLARYVEYTKQPRDDGGWAIGHIGPIPEGFIAWVATVLLLVGLARLIGRRTTR